MSDLPWKKFFIIFSVALVARVLFSIVIAAHGEANFISPGDSQAYMGIAHNLIEHSVYTNFDSLIPNNHRPPLYPLFLIPFFLSGIPLFFIAVVQGALVALSAGIFYLLARRIFNETVVLMAAMVFVLEPNGLLYSTLMMSEALFMVFFIPALCLLALSMYRKDAELLLYASACLALAALTRVIALPLIMLVPLVALCTWKLREMPWKTLFASAALFILIISPWLAFNVRTFSSLEFSSTGSQNLYTDNAAGLERWLYPDKATYVFDPEKRASSVPEAHALGDKALAFIGAHPLAYAEFHFLYMPRLFIHDGLNDVYTRVAGTPYAQTSSLYDKIAHHDFSGLLSEVTQRPDALISLAAKLVFALVALLCFMHPLLVWKSGGNANLLRVSLFFVGFVLLYAFLISPVGMARFRFTIHPILFLLALDSARLLLPYLRSLRRVSAPKQ